MKFIASLWYALKVVGVLVYVYVWGWPKCIALGVYYWVRIRFWYRTHYIAFAIMCIMGELSTRSEKRADGGVKDYSKRMKAWGDHVGSRINLTLSQDPNKK